MLLLLQALHGCNAWRQPPAAVPAAAGSQQTARQLQRSVV
jgi:hypothetical protein